MCSSPRRWCPRSRSWTRAFRAAWGDPGFRAELDEQLTHYAGRPSALTECPNLSEQLGCQVTLKREDLNHTGSHKINNVLGQALLAKRMGKTRLVAETGAGQHGVATATAAAKFGLECTVYMGEVDMARQELNVFRMRLLGAEVRPALTGSRTLKDAVNEAMRDWVATVAHSHYCLGSVMGPHPYPWMVREFNRVLGEEAPPPVRRPPRRRSRRGHGLRGRRLQRRRACSPGSPTPTPSWSASSPPGGAALARGVPGVVHGMRSYLLQDEFGQVLEADSISAGLDYPGVGPEHAALAASGTGPLRAGRPTTQVVEAFQLLSRTEGIIPALESAHAIAWIASAAEPTSWRTARALQPVGPGRQGCAPDDGDPRMSAGAIQASLCAVAATPARRVWCRT